MRDHPMLFQAPMIQALLAGRKTQTRRLTGIDDTSKILDFEKVATDQQGRSVYEMKDRNGKHVYIPAGKHLQTPHFIPKIAVGDRIWVKENYLPDPPSDDPSWNDNVCTFFEWNGCGGKVRDVPVPLRQPDHCIFAADPKWDRVELRWRPSIHMPRWASRITLTVTDVSVERLRSISERDAFREGVEYETADPPFCYVPGIWPHSITGVGVEQSRTPFSASYFKLWDYINGGGSSLTNPWVVAYTFTVTKQNIDRIAA